MMMSEVVIGMRLRVGKTHTLTGGISALGVCVVVVCCCFSCAVSTVVSCYFIYEIVPVRM